ncbi:hypothetical protein [Halosegnis marinus]
MDRGTVLDLLAADEAAFARDAGDLLGVEVPPLDAFDGPDDCPAWPDLLARRKRLVRRVWLLDDAPFGVTLAGPAYEDNPVLYANRTLRG